MSETAWSGSNGGFSRSFTRPTYQNGIHSNAFRGVPDVAANADPNTGYQVCFANSCLLVGGKSKRISLFLIAFIFWCRLSKRKISLF